MNNFFKKLSLLILVALLGMIIYVAVQIINPPSNSGGLGGLGEVFANVGVIVILTILLIVSVVFGKIMGKDKDQNK